MGTKGSAAQVDTEVGNWKVQAAFMQTGKLRNPGQMGTRKQKDRLIMRLRSAQNIS